jgi:hypothetical protein
MTDAIGKVRKRNRGETASSPRPSPPKEEREKHCSVANVADSFDAPNYD